MSDDNIYATPKAEIFTNKAALTPFFVTSKTKLLVLYFMTMGVYSIYWFYKHWKTHQSVMDKTIIPVLRAIFSIFFTHALFHRIEDFSIKKGLAKWNATFYATIFVLLSVISAIIDFFSIKMGTSGVLDIISLGLFMVLFYPLYKAQMMANQVCDDPKGQTNSQFSLYNILFIILGGFFWIVYLLDSMGLIET